MVTEDTKKGGTQKFPKNFQIVAIITDMTIHWKALERSTFWWYH
jgi:hypothetical protein